jgi:hypothetical protein
METKNFNHKEVEICKISKKPINTTKEKYAIVVECEGREIYSVGFYRGQLLLDLVRGNLTSISQELTERHKKLAGGMINQLKPFIQQLQN